MGNPHKYIFLQNLNRSKNTFDEKDFNSDNDSTNEILESNFSSRIDHPKEELRSYISLIGMSFPSECLGTSMEGLSFRPSNLEPKSKSELEHHKEMIEEHRKLYFNHLKEKFQQEKQLKDKIIRSKQEERIQEIKWENDIIPFWFKKKKDNEIKKYFYQGVPRNLRGRIWLMCIGNNFSITRDYYDIEVQKGM